MSSGLSPQRRENPEGTEAPGGIFPKPEGLEPRREQAKRNCIKVDCAAVIGAATSNPI